MSPNWLKLVRHHERRGGQGLTPAFVVGALRSPVGGAAEESAGRAQLQQLLSSIRDEAPESVWIRVARCPTIGLPVLYLRSSFYNLQEVDVQLCSPVHNRLTLAAQADYVSEPDNGIDSLTSYLWGVFREKILAGRFDYSRRTSSFKAFNDLERRFIDDALTWDEEAELVTSKPLARRWERGSL